MDCYRILAAGLVLLMAGTYVTADVASVQPQEPYDTFLGQSTWQPARKAYQLTNNTQEWVFWQASDADGLTACEPSCGWLAPAGAVTMAVRPADFVHLLAPGTYTETVTVNFEPRIRGDLNGDSVVDVFDLMRFTAAFGGNDGACDLDSNGSVNIFDLLELGQNFGRRYGSVPI